MNKNMVLNNINLRIASKNQISQLVVICFWCCCETQGLYKDELIIFCRNVIQTIYYTNTTKHKGQHYNNPRKVFNIKYGPTEVVEYRENKASTDTSLKEIHVCWFSKT